MVGLLQYPMIVRWLRRKFWIYLLPCVLTLFRPTGAYRFALANESEPGELVLTDLSGKEIRHLAFPDGPGSTQVEIETQDIPAGVYLLRWQGAHPYREKLLIAH